MQYHSREILKFAQILLILTFQLVGVSIATEAPRPATAAGGIRTGTLPASWHTGGPKCMEMSEWQVHEFNPDMYILRQSGCTDYEKPFLYLLFGSRRALLLDSGSRNSNIGPQIELVVHRWLKRNDRPAIPLLVVHTHAHGDHVAGDEQLLALHDTDVPVQIVPASVEANQAFYGIAHWPEDIGSVDLGDRTVDAIPVPGHQTAAIALYDRQTGLLFTGDNVYPGRLYIADLAAYERSNDRLLKFTDGKVVTHLLGNHIEQSRMPYVDYPVGTMYQPNEHDLALPRGLLFEIREGLMSMHGMPRLVAYRDFTLVPASPPFRNTPESDAAFKRTQEEQLRHMWDQNSP